MREGASRPRGRWQIAVFAASLVLAAIVWVAFPEPEESRRGYTASGCYSSGKELFLAAMASADLYRRTERLFSAVKYFDALEKRFGVSQRQWDVYEMLGDARMELAGAVADRELARQLRLPPADFSRREALRAYREALARLASTDEARPRLLRKEAEALYSLGRPEEALQILRELVKRFRQGDIARLQEERSIGGFIASESRIEGSDEARAVYYLAGNAALAAKRKVEQSVGAAATSVDEYRDEAQRAFRLFLGAGASGERRSAAQKALGDIAMEKAESARDAQEAKRYIEEAGAHYAAAGTAEAAFLLARVLFRSGDLEAALRKFRVRRGVSTAESRARRYMEARCLLGLGRLEEAATVLHELRTDNPDDAEAAAALVGLVEVARRAGDLEAAKRFLLEAVASRTRARSDFALPERDAELEPGALTSRLLALAGELEVRGDLGAAEELYRSAAQLDPNGAVPALRRIARMWESSGNYARAGEVHLELAEALPKGLARREALRCAAELFERCSAIANASEAASRILQEYPDDELASRALWMLGRWAYMLGLRTFAIENHSENVERYPSDVYADRSRLELARSICDGGTDADLEEARKVLASIVGDPRYGKDNILRMEALFELGLLDVRLAERMVVNGSGEVPRELLLEALRALDEALVFTAGQGPDELARSRPLAYEIATRFRPMALLSRGIALFLLGRLEESRTAFRTAAHEQAGPLAELYGLIVECKFPDAAGSHPVELPAGSPDAAWVLTCEALAHSKRGELEMSRKLAASAADAARSAWHEPDSLLSPEYWASWAGWLRSYLQGKEEALDVQPN